MLLMQKGKLQKEGVYLDLDFCFKGTGNSKTQYFLWKYLYSCLLFICMSEETPIFIYFSEYPRCSVVLLLEIFTAYWSPIKF